MRRFAHIASTVLLLASLALLFESRAFAYVDPGSGLLITQTIGAVLTAALLWFRKRIRNVFRSPQTAEKPQQPE